MSALEFLSALGSVGDLTALAAQESGDRQGITNSHIHLPPNFSAFDSVQEAVDLAASEKVVAVGCGNYYDYSVYLDLVTRAQAAGIFPLFGTEIITLDRDMQAQGIRANDPGNPGKVYICGKGITQFIELSDTAKALLGRIRSADTQRMKIMTEKMAAAFAAKGIDTGLTDGKIIARVAKRHQSDPDTIVLQERHLCQAFQEVLFERVPEPERLDQLTAVLGVTPKSAADHAVGLQNEIRTHLMKAGKPCFVPEDFISLTEAAELIHALGGMVCYPILADGANPACEFEADVDQLIATLKAQNIHMVEFIPLRNQAEVLSDMVPKLRQAGLVVVAGTEHNTLDKIAIEPSCVGGVSIPTDLQDIFWEGTCVIAAHQYLASQGRCGFVDSEGQPNPSYASAAERIAAFKKLGAAVIRAYSSKN